MTVFTKPSLFVKKDQAPLVNENICDEEKVDIHPPSVPWVGHRPTGGLMCLSLTALLMASVGIVCGLLLYRQYLQINTHRYQGFCRVPYSDKEEAHLIWKPDSQVKFYGDFLQKANKAHKNKELNDESMKQMIDPDLLEDTVLEKVDIGDRFEKVFVIDSGRNFEFIHDFTVNLTAIVDDRRCFLMTLDPNVVLPPEQLISTIQAGAPFDVRRVRTTVRADLAAPPPDLASASFILADSCHDKPTYMLHVDDSILLRKRSADEEPGHHYVQFAGRHLQQIEIKNLDDVFRFEHNNPAAAAARSLAAASPAPR